jgi:hypothetical protein
MNITSTQQKQTNLPFFVKTEWVVAGDDVLNNSDGLSIRSSDHCEILADINGLLWKSTGWTFFFYEISLHRDITVPRQTYW